MSNPKRLFSTSTVVFIISSGLITFVLYVLFSDMFLPCQLRETDKTGISASTGYFYHDLNRDRFSEKYRINNAQTDITHYYLQFYKYSGRLIDQFTFYSPIKHQNIFFNDLDGNGYEECMVFTQQGDSLYLSAIDIGKGEFIMFRQPVLQAQKPYPYKFWDMEILGSEFMDVNRDGWNEIVFIFSSGHSEHPRGIKIYDIRKRELVDSLYMNAKPSQLLLTDITGNGRREIIILTNAVGNLKKEDVFTDWYSWVFVLNRRLNFVFAPIRMAPYSASLSALTAGANRRVIINENQTTNPGKQGKVYVLNPDGTLTQKKTFAKNNTLDGISFLSGNTRRFFYANNQGEIFLLDERFNLIKKKKTSFERAETEFIQDINSDNRPEIILNTTKGLLVLDGELETQAFHKTSLHPLMPATTIRRNGPGQPLTLGINTPGSFVTLQLEGNIYHTLLPLFMGLVFLTLFIVHVQMHRFTLLINIYITYFTFSLRRSNRGTLLLNRKGHVFYFNKELSRLLEIRIGLFKGQSYKQVFCRHVELGAVIQKAVVSAQPVEYEYAFTVDNKPLKGLIAITPFKTRFNYHFATLIEVQDHTMLLQSDRQKVWSRTVRKLAHDIKTPLSSIQMGIDLIQQKLNDSHPEEAERLLEDFRGIEEDLARVKDLTRQFLKFTNLEKLNFQPAGLKQIVHKALSRFSAYLGSGIVIKVDIDDKADLILADENQLELVFHTLMENAIDAVKGRGKIFISARLARDLSSMDGEYIFIEVSDSGPPVEERVLTHLFEPFFSTKKEGTGMGLVIAQKIIQDHFGRIEARMDKNAGLVFTIRLPKIDTKRKIME